MTKQLRTTLSILVLTLGLALGCHRSGSSGGGAGAEAKPLKLAFVTNNTSEFWKIACAGIHEYEREGKVQVDLKLPASGTAENQNQILQDLASQGYDGIAVSVIAPNDQVAVLDKIAEKTNLITFDSDAPKATLPVEHSVETGVDVIDKSNVADFKAKLAELKRS